MPATEEKTTRLLETSDIARPLPRKSNRRKRLLKLLERHSACSLRACFFQLKPEKLYQDDPRLKKIVQAKRMAYTSAFIFSGLSVGFLLYYVINKDYDNDKGILFIMVGIIGILCAIMGNRIRKAERDRILAIFDGLAPANEIRLEVIKNEPISLKQ